MIRILVLALAAQALLAQPNVVLRELIGAKQTPLRRPSALAVGIGGLIYISDTGNNRLIAVDTAGTVVLESSQGGSAGELRWPVGVAEGNGGRVYVADTGNKRIVEFTRLLEWKGELAVKDESGSAVEPRFLAVDNVGDLFVYELDDAQMVRYDSFYNVVSRLGGQTGNYVSAPTSMCYSPAYGLLWTSQRTGELFHCDAFLNDPRRFSAIGNLNDLWQVTARDSTVYLIAESSLVRWDNGRLDSLTFEQLEIGPLKASDIRLDVSSTGLIYLLDTRRGSLHSLNWP
ncbi:MAG: hypothetical protein KDB65_11345 [Calditrichaeota bacterium]|nr:hypothetical protein [Calditrichota bacterium]MCB9368065.1 hypothetical protein [Calditrichota bacterium]